MEFKSDRNYLYEFQDIDKYYRTDHLVKNIDSWMPEVKGFKGSILIAGCGRGDAVNLFENAVGFDFNKNLTELWNRVENDKCFIFDALNLDKLKKKYDLCISADFLEHLPKKHFFDVLEKMVKISPVGVHILDTRSETSYRGPDNRSLHELKIDKDKLYSILTSCGFTVQKSDRNRFLKITWGTL